MCSIGWRCEIAAVIDLTLVSDDRESRALV